MATVNTTPADLGAVTGYAIAVTKGYQGSLDDWVQLQMDAATDYQNAMNVFEDKILASATEPESDITEVWIDTSGTGTVQIPEIKDNQTSDVDTWSSEKINAQISKLSEEMEAQHLTMLMPRKKAGWIDENRQWAGIDGTTAEHSTIPVNPGDQISITAGNSGLYYAILQSYSESAPALSADNSFGDRIFLSKNTTATFTAPADAKYLYVSLRYGNTDMTPASCIVNGFDHMGSDSVSSIKSMINRAYPAYYDEQIQTVISEVQSNNLLSVHGDSLIMITDPHLNNQSNSASFYNSGYALPIAKYISEHTNNKTLILGGDVLTSAHTKENALSTLRDYYNSAHSLFGSNYRPLRGNHDNNKDNNTVQQGFDLTESEIYASVFKSMENNVHSDGNMYYYWDNETRKIRYLALNFGTDGEYSKAQLQWVRDTIQDLDAGWSVVVFTHGIYSSNYTLRGYTEYLFEILGAYNARGNGTTAVRGVEYDFYNAQGCVKIVIGGHSHSWGYTTINSIPAVTLKKDGVAQNGTNIGKLYETYFTMIDFDLDHNDAYFAEFWKTNETESDASRTVLSRVVPMASI